jgi:quinol-cytochrome oxidoreductase complex cytochrome b subunit
MLEFKDFIYLTAYFGIVRTNIILRVTVISNISQAIPYIGNEIVQ